MSSHVPSVKNLETADDMDNYHLPLLDPVTQHKKKPSTSMNKQRADIHVDLRSGEDSKRFLKKVINPNTFKEILNFGFAEPPSVQATGQNSLKHQPLLSNRQQLKPIVSLDRFKSTGREHYVN